MRNRSRITDLSMWVFGVLVAGVCTGYAQDVSVNYVPGTDFSQYKTYKWIEVQGAAQPDEIVDTQIKQSIDGILASKGLTKVSDDTADLFVGYQVAVDQERQWNAYGMGGPGAWRYGGMGTATSSTINIGTLALDMYDASAKQLVWKGQASKTLNPPKDPEKRQKNLDKAMAKLLKDFPPKKK